MFGVNPVGVQSDGTLVEGTGDLTPDYVFTSKGRLTAYSYEVEIEIPFKTLRFSPSPVQRWGLNVVRRVQSRGHEDTWTPATRSGPSFLAQSGTLEGLTDLKRGLVLDLNPVVTLGKEERSARVERHLPGIGLDLREIGIDGAGQCQGDDHPCAA